MLTGWEEVWLAGLIGLIGGVVLGLAARLSRFCTLGALEDYLYAGSDLRLRMWVLALGTGITTVFLLNWLGFIALEQTVYLDGGWNPIAHVIGGLVFGYGMAIAGNCGFGALARLGGGDLRSFVIVVVLGVSAYVVMSGPLVHLRLWLFPPDLLTAAELPGYAHGLAALTGMPAPLFGMVAGTAFMVLALASRAFRAEPVMVLSAFSIGLSIAATLAATSWLHHRTFGGIDVETFTFAAPVGETILFAMTASGTSISFAVGAVSGVWFGAFLGALFKGLFRWEACDDPRELRRQIFGAAMMGGGAVVASGCSVGQGLSGFSVLAYGAPLTLAAIALGASFGLRQLIHGFARA